MKRWTERKLAMLVTGALWMLGSTACVSSPPPGSEGSDPPGGEGGSGDTGETTGQKPQACDVKSVVAKTSFSQTSGPSAVSFRHLAATKDVVFASTSTGLHRSKDGGETWSFVGIPELAGHAVVAMAALDDEVFVTTSATVLRTSDGGATWKDVSTEECTAPQYLSVHGKDLFALAIGRPFRWDTYSATWVALPALDHGFDVLESDGEYLYANSVYTPGVFRLDLAAVEAGEAAEWTAVEDLPEWGYSAFAFADGVKLAANANHVFRSKDGGTTWKPLDMGTLNDVADLLIEDGALFAATSAGLQVSVDGGEKWTTTEMMPFLSRFALASDGKHVFAASHALLRSNGADGSWTELHVLGDSVKSVTATEEGVISVSQSGQFRSADGGASWSPITTPELEGLSWHSSPVARDGKLFALGYTSLLVSEDDGATFVAQPISAGGSYAYKNLLTAIDDGLVMGISSGAGSKCGGAQSITSTLYLSTDRGATWAPAMNGFPTTFTDCYGVDYGPSITSLVQADGVLVATSWYSGAFRSTDKGQSWTLVTTSEEIGNLVRVAKVDGAVLGASALGGVARSVDGGVTWKKAGLDGLPVSSFVTSGDHVFAGVGASDKPEGGVFYSADAGATWQRADEAFGARVSSLAVRGHELVVGTFDQSIWTAPVACAD